MALDQNVTGHVYLDILQSNVVHDVCQHYGNDWIPVDDNAIPPKANGMVEHLNRQGVSTIYWPLWSLKMNTNEHV